jgi:hypothetical protein
MHRSHAKNRRRFAAAVALTALLSAFPLAALPLDGTPSAPSDSWVTQVTAWLLDLVPGDPGAEADPAPDGDNSVDGPIGSGIDPDGGKNDHRPKRNGPKIGHSD